MSLYNDGVVIKIRQGTGKLSGDGLCVTCRYSRVIVDRTGKAIQCNQSWPAKPIYNPIYDCNQYNNKSLPSLDDMEKIAWEFATPPDKGKPGFVPPQPKDK